MTVVEKKFQYGAHEVSLQTGLLARQADGAVLVQAGKMQLLVTVVVDKKAKDNDFFPLSVHFISKSYAYGKIPGGFKRREGPPTESDILISRLVDRPLRPLFDPSFSQEVQVVITQLSDDPQIPADIFAIIGSCAAVKLAGLPLASTIAGLRLGLDSQGQLVINPPEQNAAQLDLVVAGHGSAILMVECCANEVSEETLAGALVEAERILGGVTQEIDSFLALASCAQSELPAAAPSDTIAESAQPTLSDISALFHALAPDYLQRLKTAAFDKNARLALITQVESHVVSSALEQYPDAQESRIKKLIAEVFENMLREQLISQKTRIDGRSPSEIRPIAMQVGFLKQAHGSALFTRGSTQSLTSVTLGGSKDAQLVDSYDGKEVRDAFMLHYNFPPFSVGDLGALGSPKRREIGHGRLARRALEATLPSLQQFPYVLRVVSEILESDGSSSMATVCASSLALMDAGVPISRPVAGIAMGLVQQGNDSVVLSDICGEEDAFGDMDFKVAGTTQGVTALQMDMKIAGVSAHLMTTALEQARQGRLQILEMIKQTLPSSRDNVAAHAPRIESMKIRPDQIREVIGKGGATIKMLTEVSGATLDIQDDGTIQILAQNQEQADKAKSMITQMTTPLTVGAVYEGQVTKMLDFGFVVALLSGKEGLVHISECPFAPDELSQKISIGQRLSVRVSQYDQSAQKIRFSMKLMS